ncbi:MAG: hypothetical protein GXX96_15415 [Planctomycetaceae bacterium]|nr:hypothetical protein [Planctomycetaceae bacterium]
MARVEGPVEYEGADGPFVVIFTHDWSNQAARTAEATLLSRCAEQHLIRVFGTTGTAGREMADGLQPFRVFTDQDTIFWVSEYMLREGKIGSIAFLGLVSSADLALVGLEDEKQYAEVRRFFSDHDYMGFSQANERRFPILVDNLLAALREEGESIGGATLIAEEYLPFKRVLTEQRIGHVVVRSLSKGANQACSMDPHDRDRDDPTKMDPMQRMFEDEEAAKRARKALNRG